MLFSGCRQPARLLNSCAPRRRRWRGSTPSNACVHLYARVPVLELAIATRGGLTLESKFSILRDCLLYIPTTESEMSLTETPKYNNTLDIPPKDIQLLAIVHTRAPFSVQGARYVRVSWGAQRAQGSDTSQTWRVQLRTRDVSAISLHISLTSPSPWPPSPWPP